jgi:hypothetical protein
MKEHGMRVRAGQFHRSDEEQERLREAGLSRVTHSRHQDRLAADLVLDLWQDGEWVYQKDTEAYSLLGEFWKAIDPDNVWGGDWSSFPDGNHFERKVD